MFSAVKLQVFNPVLKSNCNHGIAGKFESRRPLSLRLPDHRFASLSSSEPSVSSQFTASVGSSSPSLQLSHWNLTQRHILTLNFVACAVAVSATWLFFSAIPTLLAFKRAAESLEKLLDVTREELLDLLYSQEITQGVKSSTRAVRLAEERLRRLTNMSPSVSMQEVIPIETKAAGPVLARTARGIREGVVKGRAVLQIFFTLTKFSRMAVNYFKSRASV